MVLRTGFSPDDLALLDCEVVVICSAFNQESVLHEALDSFVAQETNFSFVVLVHDDASTDSTANIIRTYAERYPRLIKGVYESENQYQKGKLFWYLDYLRKSKAPYIAFCEGDDYWIANNKLKLQREALERNPDCSFCFTNAKRIDSSTARVLGDMLPAYSWEKGILNKAKLDTVDLLKMTFLPTASFFARRDSWLEEPELPNSAFRGDRAHQLFLSLCGFAYYLDVVTCAYRVNNPNSVMGEWAKSDERMLAVHDSYIMLYRCFDDYSEFRYHEAVQDAIDLKLFDKMLLTGEKGLVSKESAYRIARERGMSGRAKYRLFCLSPAFYRFVRRLGCPFSSKER